MLYGRAIRRYAIRRLNSYQGGGFIEIRGTMRASIKLLSERFPYVQTEAQHLFERNEGFRDLCEEYEACAEAFRRLETSRPADDPMRLEYAALSLRLEGELLRYLQAHRGA
jgi:hypothetical protein